MPGIIRARRIGRKVMEWFSRKTSIAGIQISNWMIVLGAVIVILLIYTSMQVGQRRFADAEASSLMSPISLRDFHAACELIIEEAKTAERDARKARALITELDQRIQQEGVVGSAAIKSSIA
jgi:hypothetical protein